MNIVIATDNNSEESNELPLMILGKKISEGKQLEELIDIVDWNKPSSEE